VLGGDVAIEHLVAVSALIRSNERYGGGEHYNIHMVLLGLLTCSINGAD